MRNTVRATLIFVALFAWTSDAWAKEAELVVIEVDGAPVDRTEKIKIRSGSRPPVDLRIRSQLRAGSRVYCRQAGASVLLRWGEAEIKARGPFDFSIARGDKPVIDLTEGEMYVESSEPTVVRAGETIAASRATSYLVRVAKSGGSDQVQTLVFSGAVDVDCPHAPAQTVGPGDKWYATEGCPGRVVDACPADYDRAAFVFARLDQALACQQGNNIGCAGFKCLRAKYRSDLMQGARSAPRPAPLGAAGAPGPLEDMAPEVAGAESAPTVTAPMAPDPEAFTPRPEPVLEPAMRPTVAPVGSAPPRSDAETYFRQGMSEHEAGDEQAAKRFLREALMLNDRSGGLTPEEVQTANDVCDGVR